MGTTFYTPEVCSWYTREGLLGKRGLTDLYREQFSTIPVGRSTRLVLAVVSSNWQDDYLRKLADYETLGIPEYWIVD